MAPAHVGDHALLIAIANRRACDKKLIGLHY
jgi:hypothetical protein